MRAKLLFAGIVVGVAACSDGVAPPPPPPPPEPPGPSVSVVVSDPVVPPVSTARYSANIRASTHGESVAVTYVSLPPGAVPRGRQLSIKNLRTGGIIGAPLVDGGLDPIPVAAAVGDTLELIAVDSAGTSARFLRVVPRRLPPTVVRTRPPRGGRNVPLNLNVYAVFSEPIQRATVSSATVILTLDGERVPGTVVPSKDGLTADYVLDRPLLPNRSYALRISRSVLDGAGDPLDADVEAQFTTGTESTASGFIAFARGTGMNVFTPDFVTDIWTARGDGSYARNLTNHPANDHSPAWSPDGSKITFTTDRSGKRAIFVMNADGSDPRRLIAGEFEDFSAEWSPDGKRIAFARKTNTSDSQIFVVGADGSGAVAVTSGSGLRYGPSWSPDGQQIAYTHHAFSGGRYQTANIRIVAADGSGFRSVTDFRSDAACPFARNPKWSPDGTKILVYACQLGVNGIYQMAPDGSDIIRISPLGEAAWDPVWADGGKRIVFVKDHKLYSMTSLGQELIQISFGDDADQQPAWRP